MIFFIGMPGTGKSYWASTLATACDMPFIDLDSYIEEKMQMTISDYFEQYGEASFREKEQELLLQIIAYKEKNQVVACGGGTPAFFDNLQKMKDAGCVVYLQAEMEVIVQRLANSATRRPLLEGKEINSALSELYDQRYPFFSQADYIFDVESISVAKFEKIIPTCIDRH